MSGLRAYRAGSGPTGFCATIRQRHLRRAHRRRRGRSEGARTHHFVRRSKRALGGVGRSACAHSGWRSGGFERRTLQPDLRQWAHCRDRHQTQRLYDHRRRPAAACGEAQRSAQWQHRGAARHLKALSAGYGPDVRHHGVFLEGRDLPFRGSEQQGAHSQLELPGQDQPQEHHLGRSDRRCGREVDGWRTRVCPPTDPDRWPTSSSRRSI
jgi:hypothetical protein